MLQIGTVLQNRYHVDTVLGQGGMGTVFRASDRNLQRDCVIKELLIQAGATQHSFQGAIAQFQHEAMTLSRLNHPNLPRVTDYFREGSNYYLVMDFVGGSNLESMMGASAMAEMDVLRYATQLLSVLEYVHAQNVVHRDIKPSNIIIQPNGHLMLVDFGLAKQANLQTVQYMHGYGTEAYAPPEQISGGTDPRSDLFSVGATMYHLLAGRPPISAADRMAGTDLPLLSTLRPNLTPNTTNAVMRAMEMDKRNRFQSANEFKSALQLLTRPVGGGVGGYPPPTIQSYQPVVPSLIAPPVPSSGQSGISKGVIAALVGLAVLICAGVAIVVQVFNSNLSPGTSPAAAAQQTVIVAAPTDDPATVATASIAGPDPNSTDAAIVITSAPIVITATPDPTQSAPPTSTPAQSSANNGSGSERGRLGQSANGKDIGMTRVGHTNGAGPVIIVLGRIAGEQYDTSDTVTELAGQFVGDPNSVPNDAVLYLIENFNPDGNGSSRFNGHGVDLNRNWSSFNWTRNPPVPGASSSGAGGAQPFSEPETQALRDLIVAQKASGRKVIVIVLHSSAKSGKREVFPGYTQASTHAESGQMARNAADILGFSFSDTGSDPTTGELILWCGEQGIPSIDIFWSRAGSNRPSLSKMVEVISALSK